MQFDFSNILFWIAAVVFALATIGLVVSFFAARRAGKGMAKPGKKWKRARICAVICMLVSAGLAAYALLGTEAPRPMMTTVGQLSDEIKAIAERTPDGFTYTESSGSPETFVVTVDDPAVAREALDIVLSAAVDRRGCYMDMYWMQEEEYCFTFGEENYKFSFVPGSYFYFDGEYHELGENRLARMRNYLHEKYDAAELEENSQTNWYGDDAELQTNFVDNGDEARSVTELTLSAGEETVTGVIEGAYDVLFIEKQPDGYVICYTYGDYYSHDAVRSSYVTVENGEMIIADIAQ